MSARRLVVAATAVLLTVAGTGWAVVTTGGTGGGTVVLTGPSPKLRLSGLATQVDPLTSNQVVLDVRGTSRSQASLVLRGGLAAPLVQVAPGDDGDCPDTSFTTGPIQYTGTVVRPARSAVVARVPLRFMDQPGADQAGCSGAVVSLTWP